ncbi:unnamed protein product, partial [Rotaria sp. Silwood2]
MLSIERDDERFDDTNGTKISLANPNAGKAIYCR